MIAAGRKVEEGLDGLGDLGAIDALGAEGVHEHRDRSRDADGVGHLDLAAFGRAGGDDVLGDPARGVGAGAVDLGGVLAGERAAAVARHPAVGVDDDLATGETGVGVRSAEDELARRVHEDPHRDWRRGRPAASA